jgi:hypothetical protein
LKKPNTKLVILPPGYLLLAIFVVVIFASLYLLVSHP